MKPEDSASTFFFLLGKSLCLLLHCKALSPGAFTNSAPIRLGPKPGTVSLLLRLSSKNLGGSELLPLCSPSSCSPASGPQQLKCQDQFLEKSWWRFALQLHTEQMNCQPKAAHSVHQPHLQLLPNFLASFPANSRVFICCTINQVSFQFCGICTFDFLRKLYALQYPSIIFFP